MGGNIKVFDQDTGKIEVPSTINMVQTDSLPPVDRTALKSAVRALLEWLNGAYDERYGEPIWEYERLSKMLSTGEVFNGSSELLFSKSISDKEFKQHKREVGDIDVTVPKEKLKGLEEILAANAGKRISSSPDVTYVGQHPNVIGKQLNTMFKWHDVASERDIRIQVDFEGVGYTPDGKPDEFAKFGHSSSWDDVRMGIKGAMHKLLLRSVTSKMSTRSDIIILTPTSPLSGPKVKVMKGGENPWDVLSFSVEGGVRPNVVQQFDEDGTPVHVNGKLAYKEIKAREAEERGLYETTIAGIFRKIFQLDESYPVPDADIKKLGSFVGLLDLLEGYSDEATVRRIYVDFINEKTFGSGQELVLAYSVPELEKAITKDKEAKMAAINKMREKFSYLKSYDDDLSRLADEYAAKFPLKKLETR